MCNFFKQEKPPQPFKAVVHAGPNTPPVEVFLWATDATDAMRRIMSEIPHGCVATWPKMQKLGGLLSPE